MPHQNNDYISTPKQKSTLHIPYSNMEKNSCQNSNAAYSSKQQWQIQKVVKTSAEINLLV
jgi:hypothetical protein